LPRRAVPATSLRVYRSLVFPLLKHADAERVHHAAARALALAQASPGGKAVLRAIAGAVPERPVEMCGLRFPNVVGVAAGFDKDVRLAPGLWALGFGHVEVGTLTPRPQAGNPRPRVFRLAGDYAVINRMGFPNCGVEAAVARLRAFHRARGAGVLGVSLGKQKETPLERASEDYVAVMRAVHAHADYLAENISSPNTPGLRELQGGDYLGHLLRTLAEENDALAQKSGRRPPLLVKIAPDLSPDELRGMVDTAMAARIDGVIATNTTLARPPLISPHAGETGGLSGRPLTKKSTEIVAAIREHAGPSLPIVAVGGVFSAKDAREKLDAGATLVQVYTGLIYEGPGMAGRILREMEAEG